MKQAPCWIFATIAACVAGVVPLAGCGSTPGATQPAPSAGRSADPPLSGSASRVPPAPPPQHPTPIAVATARFADGVQNGASAARSVGFALHVSGDLVAFDPRTGSELGRYVFGRQLEDVCWDARTKRVLIVEHDAYDDGSRVHALSWGDSGFVHESSSPVLPGHSRVFAARDRVYAISDEQGVVWNALDDDLAPVGQFEPLLRPTSLVPRAAGGLFGLDTSATLASEPAEQLLAVSRAGDHWHVTQMAFLAPGRPSARLVAGAEPGSAFLLHKSAGEGTIELARVSTLAPVVPPDFHVVTSGAGRGELEGAAFDQEQGVVVAAIARVPIARLALVPTITGQPTAIVSLDAPIASTLWWPRDLVRDAANGRLVVATALGLRAFSPSGSMGAPALTPDAGFSAPDLRGPIALAE